MHRRKKFISEKNETGGTPKKKNEIEKNRILDLYSITG